MDAGYLLLTGLAQYLFLWTAMEDFLKAIWTNDFIVEEKTNDDSPIFL
jgi:hypothetical protein